MAEQTYGTWTSPDGGITRVAYRPHDAVYFKADGWSQAVSDAPPKAGAGSSTEVWREYAGSKGVDVPDEAPRAEVIEALHEAGVPTE